MKTKTPSLRKSDSTVPEGKEKVEKPPLAKLFDEKDECFINPDILWHMEEDIEGDPFQYTNTEIPIPPEYIVWCKSDYCVDIYHTLTKEWLPLGDLGVLCEEYCLKTSPSLGCGRIEEILAFVASKPNSRFYENKKMKGVIVKSLHYYKKFFIPLLCRPIMQEA